jgi:hypothetical protein
VQEYRRWGFDAGEGALLGAAGRVTRVPAHPRELADLAVGLERAELTPLHGALLAAAIANGGRLADPRLATGRCGPLGLRDAEDAAPAPREVIDPAVADRLRRAMQEVMRAGTGSGLEPPGFPVAMKTGTGATAGLGYHVNYLGFAPAGDPLVAFCVRVTGERTSPRITRAAREVTARLLQALADRRDALAAGRTVAERHPVSFAAAARVVDVLLDLGWGIAAAAEVRSFSARFPREAAAIRALATRVRAAGGDPAARTLEALDRAAP